MDLNYDIQTWNISLKRIAMTKIVQHIVEVARLDPSATIEPKIIESRGTERVQKLKLPSSFITEIIIMIRPIAEEMLSWYYANGFSICPILTSYGTVDVAKSARSLIKCTNHAGSSPFVQACEFCLEDEIFVHGSRLTAAEKFTYEDCFYESPTIQYFWYEVYGGQFVKKITLNDLSYEQCSEGFKRATKFKNLHAMKYFLEKLSLVALWPANPEYIWYICPQFVVSANICAMFFRTAQSAEFRNMNSSRIIKALLNWPNQHLFLKAAKAVLPNLHILECLKVATTIIGKVLQGYQYFDYKGVFFSFWEMNEHHKQELRLRESIWPEVYKLLSNCFLTMDENIVITVFDDLSEHTRQEVFRLFEWDCAIQIYEKKYELSTFAMNLCKAGYEPYYLRLKNFFEEEFTRGIPPLRLPSTLKCVSRKQWNTNFQEFMRLISESETLANP